MHAYTTQPIQVLLHRYSYKDRIHVLLCLTRKFAVMFLYTHELYMYMKWYFIVLHKNLAHGFVCTRYMYTVHFLSISIGSLLSAITYLNGNTGHRLSFGNTETTMKLPIAYTIRDSCIHPTWTKQDCTDTKMILFTTNLIFYYFSTAHVSPGHTSY